MLRKQKSASLREAGFSLCCVGKSQIVLSLPMFETQKLVRKIKICL